jgi:sporulation protein YlmC with PRC-barrel domain
LLRQIQRLSALYYLSLVVISALLLTACSPAEQGESTLTEQPGLELTEAPLLTEQSGLATEGQATEHMATEAQATEPGLADTEPAVTVEEPRPVVDTPGGDATAMPEATAESGTPGTGEGEAGDLRAAEILPATGRAGVTRLSALSGYLVVDTTGASLGTVNDYILNLCEAHLVYLLVDADPALQLEGGSRLVIPYENEIRYW